MGFGALVHADSRSPDGVRLTTMEVTFPRNILAEVNTHRMLSKSSASSRAIPVEKMLKRVALDPYVPPSWGKNQKGMQAEVEVSEYEAARAREEWFMTSREVIQRVDALMQIGIHKQITNRLLEPFLWHTCILTGTEWSNFFHLRNNPQASPDFQTIAAMMQKLYEESEPVQVGYESWHLPLIHDEDVRAVAVLDGDSKAVAAGGDWPERRYAQLTKISVARCARVSYLTHDGKRDLQADIDLHDRLLTSGHMSPFEHVARPATEDDDVFMMCKANEYNRSGPSQWWSGNFRGWVQYRKTIPYEDDILAPRQS